MEDRQKKRDDEEYDDLVIAPMNVEGMPWYRKDPPGVQAGSGSNHKFSKLETFYIVLGTVKAALLIAGAFLGAFALLILLICAFS